MEGEKAGVGRKVRLGMGRKCNRVGGVVICLLVWKERGAKYEDGGEQEED